MMEGEEITGVTWKLMTVVLEGREVEGVEGVDAFIILGPDHQAYGKGGCNRFFASYQLDDGMLRFGPLGSTKMYCQEVMEVEAAFFQALEQVRVVRREGDQLHMRSEGCSSWLSFLWTGDHWSGTQSDG